MLSTVVLSNENQTCRGGGGCHELECHLVIVKRENYKAEIERYIAHEKESCKRRFL